ELFISALAVGRLGAIHVPLFTAFGPQAIAYRVNHSGAQIVITDSENRAKLSETASESNPIDTSRIHVITVTSESEHVLDSKSSDIQFWNSLYNATPLSKNSEVTGDDLFILLFTSGTTGQPKGVEVPIN